MGKAAVASSVRVAEPETRRSEQRQTSQQTQQNRKSKLLPPWIYDETIAMVTAPLNGVDEQSKPPGEAPAG